MLGLKESSGRGLLLATLFVIATNAAWAQISPVPVPPPDGEEIGLDSAQCDVWRLTDATRSGFKDFLVDDCYELRFIVRSSSANVTANIVGPMGQTINAGNIASFGGAYYSSSGVPDQVYIWFTDDPGHTQTFWLPTLGRGTYRVNFSYPGGTFEEVVFTDLILDSPLRTTLFLASPIGVAGGTVTLSAAVFDDSTPIQQATVSLLVLPPRGRSTMVKLRDNGQGGDSTIGDGLYSGRVTTVQAGTYRAVATIQGLSSTGALFLRTAGTAFNVVPSTASFQSGSFFDQGVDDNGNMLFDRVRISAPVLISKAGTYRLSVSLSTVTGQSLAASGSKVCAAGSQYIDADLLASDVIGAGEDGPFQIDQATLIRMDATGPVTCAFRGEINQSTAAYLLTQFDRPPLELTGNNSDQGVDTDSDLDYDYLDVLLGMNVLYGGAYEFSCELEDLNGKFIQRIEGTQTFAAQSLDAPLVLRFPGEPIHAFAADGPLFVRRLSIHGQGAELSEYEVYQTAPYTAQSFNAQQGAAMFIIVFNNTGQVASDLHLTFDGTDGNVYVDPTAVIAGSCPIPSVPSNPPTVTNTAVIDWGTPCVQVGKAVALIVQTANGPMRYVSGFWSGPGGVNIGDIGEKDIYFYELDLGPCDGKPMHLKIERACVPQGEATYGPLVTLPDRECWWRWCCVPETLYWYRVKLCCSMSDADALLGIEDCIVILPWVPGELAPPCYFWLRVTNPKPEDLPVPGKAPMGHFPEGQSQPSGMNAPMRFGQTTLYSSDGLTWHVGQSFASAFSEVTEALAISGTDTTLYEGGFVPWLQLMAPRYFQAASVVGELAAGIDTTVIAEVEAIGIDLGSADAVLPPTLSVLMQLRGHLLTLQTALANMGAMFYSAVITSPQPFANARDALLGMAAALRTQPVLLAHLENAARNLENMARGFEVSAEMAETGMSDPTEQDFFLWGLNNRFEINLKHLTAAFTEHLRVGVQLVNWSWYHSTIRGVHVKVQDALTYDVVDERMRYLSDLSEFDIHHPGARTVNIWFKLPTHLSRVVTVGPAPNGTLISMDEPLIAGDVDGNDVIDEVDLDLVSADFGAGGHDAPIVPRTDVDGDGIVGWNDVLIVLCHLGLQGAALPSLP